MIERLERLDEHGWLEVPCDRSWSFRVGRLVVTVWRPGWLSGCAPWERADEPGWTDEQLAAVDAAIERRRDQELRDFWGITS